MTLSACSIADGPKDLASDVFDGARYRLESPGNRVLSGDRLRVRSAPLRRWLVVESGAQDAPSVTFVDAGSGASCFVGTVRDLRFLFDVSDSSEVPNLSAVLKDSTTGAASSLHFVDSQCAEPFAPSEGARLPELVLTDPVRYLVQQREDLVTIDAHSGALVTLAKNVTWFSASTARAGFASSLRYVEALAGDRFQLLGPEGELLAESAPGARVIVPPTPNALSAVLVQTGTTLLRAELRAPYLVPIADDVCWVSPLSDPYLPIVRACSGETLALSGSGADTKRRPLPDSALRIADTPAVALALYTRSEASAEQNDIALLDADWNTAPVLGDVVPGSDLWRATPFGDTLEALVGSDSTLVRHFLDEPRTLEISRGVYQWPSADAQLPLIDNFDGESGRWVEVNGFQSPTLSVIAEGVVPLGGFAPAPVFAPGFEQSSLSIHGYFAFLRDFRGSSGELLLAHRSAASADVLTAGWTSPLAQGVVPNGFRWAFDGAVLFYLAAWNARSGEGELHAYRPGLDLDQLLARGVSSFSETSTPPGVAYTVPSGENAGLWHARLK